MLDNMVLAKSTLSDFPSILRVFWGQNGRQQHGTWAIECSCVNVRSGLKQAAASMWWLEGKFANCIYEQNQMKFVYILQFNIDAACLISEIS